MNYLTEPTYTGKNIKCRAKVDKHCLDGSKEWAGKEMDGDGTWDGDSIVCDYCYVTLMPYSPSRRLLTDEIDNAIALYRSKHNL